MPRSRRWSSGPGQARVERFGDSTDMCSLVNAKSGGCAEDCGFCAQSKYAEAETPMHAMMEPEQILEHARAAEAAGAHRFCMVTQGQGLSKRDFEKVLAGARLVAEHTNLKRCASIGHMSVDPRAGAQGSRDPARPPQRRDGRVLLPRGLDDGPLPGPAAHDRRRPRGRAGDLRGRDPQPGRDPRAAGRDGLRAGRDQPHERAHQPAQPAARDQVRRPRADGSVGGRQVDRDLPPDPPRGPVPALRRPGREPGRASGHGRQGGAQRRDDGQLPHHAGQHARGGPGDVRGPGAQRRPPARQRRPTPGPTTARAGSRARRRTSSRPRSRQPEPAPARDPAVGSLHPAALRGQAARSPRPDGAPNRTAAAPGTAEAA